MDRTLTITIYSILLVILLFLSFVFSSADMCYGSVDASRFIEGIEDKNRKHGRINKAKKLASNYEKTITTILFCNDTVNAGLDSIATLLGVNLAYLIFADEAVAASQGEKVGLIASLCVLVFKIIFGEIVPKSLARVKNYSFSLAYANVISVLKYVFCPITVPVSYLGSLIAKLFKKNVEEIEITEDDLHEMIDSIEEQGTVDEEKAELLHETIKYTHTLAEEIMTPRVEVYAIDIDDDFEDIINDEELYLYTRVPVYEGTIDNVIGYIQVRTLMTKRFMNEEFTLRDILLEPLRFPRTAEINNILRTFKKTKSHFALVIDEYGGLDGILTMEDILEEIVGEIWDEQDATQEPVVERKDGSYILDGNLTIEDFCDLFEIDFEEVNSQYLTVAGLIIELLDDNFAKVDDEVEFENVHIKVIALDDNGAVNKIIANKIEEE